MAPITCKVVDGYGHGVQGVRVTLDCRNRFRNHTMKLESFTDEQGGISFWYPSPVSHDFSALEPQIVDAVMIPYVALTFHPRSQLMPPQGPWLSIRADLYLPSMASHGVVLHLEESPRLEYTPYPVSGSMGQLMASPQALDILRTPSPLQLPPPLLSGSSYSSSSDDDLEPTTDEENEIVTGNRKRKLDLEMGGAPPTRRQRTEYM